MYSKKKVGLLILQFLVCMFAFGQIDSTYQLDDVEIVGIDLSRFSSGTVLQKIESTNSGGLSNIGRNTTIHFKNYGNQQLSTIAFRGTSASQTNVIWNGLQVN
ncbi:MAG: TonB-dependent receptor, partial [Bacteroidota bacterium]